MKIKYRNSSHTLLDKIRLSIVCIAAIASSATTANSANAANSANTTSSSNKANTDKMAARLIELRKEIDLLNQNLEMKKKNVFNEINILASQRTEYEANIRSEEIRKKQISIKIAEQRNKINTSTGSESDLKAVFTQSTDQLAEYINASLPIKIHERLSSINALKNKLATGEIRVTKALSNLHSIIQDEHRLTKENSLDSATIKLANNNKLARVAKLGMFQLYFETSDGEYGIAEKAPQTDTEWEYKVFTNNTKIRATKYIFDGLAKQIRTGHYKISMNKPWRLSTDEKPLYSSK